MSYRATKWAKQQGLRGSRQAVLYQLADMADPAGLCHPGHDLIADLIGFSRATVIRAMKELEQQQLITRTRRTTNAGYRTSDQYLLNLEGVDLSCNVQPESPAVQSATVQPRLTVVPPIVEEDLSCILQPEIEDDLSCNLSDPMLQIAPDLSCTVQQQRLTTSVNHQGTTSNTQELEPVGVDAFYKIWPKKKDKPAATRAWVKAIKRATPEQIIAAAVAYRDNPGRPEVKYIPYPATWLNADGWNDELDGVYVQAKPERKTQARLNYEALAHKYADDVEPGIVLTQIDRRELAR